MGNEKDSQVATIRDAVTYLVDEQGNEIKSSSEASQPKIESGKQKAEGFRPGFRLGEPSSSERGHSSSEGKK